MRFIYILIAMTLMAGCGGVYSRTAPRSPRLAEPIKLDVSKNQLHTASSISFPTQIGDMPISSCIKYDEEGHDIAVGYDDDATYTSYTVYIYPGPSMSYFGAPHKMVEKQEADYRHAEMENVTGQISQYHPGIALASESPVSTPFGDGLMRTWTYKEKSLLGKIEKRTIALIILYDHKWFIKLRITAPARNADGIDLRIEQILKAIATQ